MKTLYLCINQPNDENVIAQHFFNVGYHLRQLIETSTMGPRSRKWKQPLNTLRSELQALKAYRCSDTEGSEPKMILHALEEAVANGVKGRPTFADLRIVLATGRSMTSVEEEYREHSLGAWFMVGVLAANWDLLSHPYDGLHEVEQALLNYLGSIIQRREAEKLIEHAYHAHDTLQNVITDWLHAQNMENLLTELSPQQLGKMLQGMKKTFGDDSLSARILERIIQTKKAKTLSSKTVITPKARQTKREIQLTDSAGYHGFFVSRHP